MPLRLSPAEAAKLGLKLPAAPSRKYRNVPTTVDGLTFDSAKEAKRWSELQLLQRVGKILDLQRQVRFEIVPPVRYQHRKVRAMVYVADFVYVDLDKGERVVEDVKGMKTRVYAMKKHLMKERLGIEIREL